MIELYAGNKAAFWCICLVLTLAGCTAHYLLYARQRNQTSQSGSTGTIKRMSVREIIFHWLKIISFFILMVTGTEMLYKTGEGHLGPHHGFLGLFFLIILVINAVSWRRDIIFRGYDRAWLQGMGGYLSKGPKHLPAGRFNAGQKMFFWLILTAALILLVTAIAGEHESHHIMGFRVGTAWSIHGMTACFATVMVIGHISTFLCWLIRRVPEYGWMVKQAATISPVTIPSGCIEMLNKGEI